MPIDTSARIAFLKKIHLFYGLKDSEFATLAEELDELIVAKNGVVFQQDGKADAFYLIYDGGVRVTRKVERKETQLAQLVKNDYFGEMALVANRKRSATVTALTDTTLLVLARSDFEKLYKRAPHIKTNLEIAVKSRQMARRLKFKWLRPDEVIYFLARKHPIILWQVLTPPLFGMIVPLGFLYVWLFVFPSLLVAIAAGLTFLALALYMIWLAIDWGNDYYIVTNQRVVWLEKVVGMYDSRQESPIGTILSVGVESNQIGKYLDYGNVIVRTFVGKIPFNNVNHPEHAGKMIEEYWNRTKENAVFLEKEALKNAIRKRLGLPLPKPPSSFGDVAPQPKADGTPPKRSAGMMAIMKFLGANTLKLRYETGDTVIYRKHWVVLVIKAWQAVLGTLATAIFFFGRMIQLALLPEQAVITWSPEFSFDTWTLVYFIAFFPFLGWFIYQIADWSNDKFEVTNDQIVDIDRTPFGSDVRNSAPLEGIMGTQYERKGLLGYLFNFGDVHITVGGTKMTFESVIDPATVQSDIDRRRMARNAKLNEAKVSGERERMAEWLAAYHRAADQLKEEERRQQQQKKG